MDKEINKQNSKRTSIGLIVSLFSLLVILGVAFAASPINPTLQISDYTLSKNNISPGDTVAITIHYSNISLANCAELTKVTLMLQSPLSIEGRDTQDIGTICNVPVDSNKSSGDTNGTVSFNIKVDKYAVTGNYPILVNAVYGRDYSKFTTSDTLYLTIVGEPELNASVISSNPLDVYAGDTANLSLSIQNNGPGKAQNTIIDVNSLDGLEVKWANSSANIGQIAGFTKTTLPISIFVPKNLTPGTYHLSVNFSYLNENNLKELSTVIIDVPVKEKADFFISETRNEVLVSGKSTLVSLTIKNTGTSKADKVKVQIKPTFPFSSDGTVRYIESLNVGEEVVLDYQITTDSKATPGNELLSAIVSYQNNEKQDFSDNIDFFLPVRNANIIDTIIDNILFLLIIVVLIVFVVLRNKKKKTK